MPVHISEALALRNFRLPAIVLSLVLPMVVSAAAKHVRAGAAEYPNVVLVVTDDQGYGDVGCHGNTVIRTPNLDRLHRESIRLTDFHVDPTCSPTRAALLTGRYSSRTGVWHTIMGRSLLREDETTLAQIFARSGYRTGIFGKWHLGDNFPHRPQDFGFHDVLIHGGGGVGQTPDYWGNDYFDDTYFHNGVPEKQNGYCTDVWFDAAFDFINENGNRPFFAYIATNAPHGPYRIGEEYTRPYRKAGVPSPRAEFYGMISNIDDNMARLRRCLETRGLAENTILIFMTDNGTAAGARGEGGFNAGMRGTKGSPYEGGHRVPCFIRWPQGGLVGGRDVDELTAHIDILPTLVELCRLDLPADVELDGRSLVSLLLGNADWPQRTLILHSQRVEHPRKWRQCAVMTERWRLIGRDELYDLPADPSQTQNVAGEFPAVVAELREAYEDWYADISRRFDEYSHIGLGSPRANPVHLTCHDWHAPQPQIPWSQSHVRRDLVGNGFWAVDVLRPGKYEITLRTRPAHVGHRLDAMGARIKIGDIVAQQPIARDAVEAKFRVELRAGQPTLQSWLDKSDGTTRGAYFVDVERVD